MSDHHPQRCECGYCPVPTALPESEGRTLTDAQVDFGKALWGYEFNYAALLKDPSDGAAREGYGKAKRIMLDMITVADAELARLRAEVRRWTQYATDNASVAVRATTDAERLRASLAEATRATEILRRAGSPMSNLCFNLAQQRGNIDASWCDSANGCRMAWDKAIERAAAIHTAEDHET